LDSLLYRVDLTFKPMARWIMRGWRHDLEAILVWQLLEFGGGELGAVVAMSSFGNSIPCEQCLFVISNGSSCEFVKLSDKWELGVVIKKYKKSLLLDVKQVRTHSLPRSSRDFWWYHGFLLLGILVILADTTWVYEIFYFSVNASPLHTWFGSQFGFFYAKVPSMDLVQYIASQKFRDYDSTAQEYYPIFYWYVILQGPVRFYCWIDPFHNVGPALNNLTGEQLQAFIFCSFVL